MCCFLGPGCRQGPALSHAAGRPKAADFAMNLSVKTCYPAEKPNMDPENYWCGKEDSLSGCHLTWVHVSFQECKTKRGLDSSTDLVGSIIANRLQDPSQAKSRVTVLQRRDLLAEPATCSTCAYGRSLEKRGRQLAIPVSAKRKNAKPGTFAKRKSLRHAHHDTA